MPFFYTTQILQLNKPFSLTIPETRHLKIVLRYGSGDTLVVVDGSQERFACVVTKSTRPMQLVPQKNLGPAPVPPYHIHLYIAPIKAPRLAECVKLATELGVSTITFLKTERARWQNINNSRLEKIVAETRKISGRGGTTILAKKSLTLPESWAQSDGLAYRLVASGHGAETMLGWFQRAQPPHHTTVGLWIGPEGGWGGQEEPWFPGTKILLGPWTLRTETAVAASLSFFWLH